MELEQDLANFLQKLNAKVSEMPMDLKEANVRLVERELELEEAKKQIAALEGKIKKVITILNS